MPGAEQLVLHPPEAQLELQLEPLSSGQRVHHRRWVLLLEKVRELLRAEFRPTVSLQPVAGPPLLAVARPEERVLS